MMHVLKILFRNTLRHKLRTGLTVLGISIAILSFGLLRTVITTWYMGVEASSASRLWTRNAISLIFPLPIAYKEKIRQTEGVKFVSHASWFGGIYIDEKHFFAQFAVEPETHMEAYSEYYIPPDQKAAVFRDRKAAWAGRKLAARYGWKIGDVITLKGTIYPGTWEFVLRAIYRGTRRDADETVFFFHWDYLNETLKKTAPARADQVGAFIDVVRNPDNAADVAARIDKTFKNSLAETLTETEKAFVLGFISMSQAIITVIQLVSFAVIAIILAVVANTMSMTARERRSEHATLKTLGFGGFRIAGLIFGESLVITMIGCALGIALTFPTAQAFGNVMGQYFPSFNVTVQTIWLDLAVSVLVGLLAAVIPTWQAIRMPVAEGLRRVG
jgi:putative ABC transport system permease protein